MSDSFQLGKYTVHPCLRADNPAFPIFRIFIGQKFIGNQFSMPSESDCQWLERQADPITPVYGRKCKARKFSTGGYYTKNATSPTKESA